MKKLIWVLIVVFSLSSVLVNGQFASVNYDYELNRFGENEPLPAEKSILFSGSIPNGVDYVEISIFSSKGKDNRTPLYTSVWKRPFDKTGNTFSLPVNYQLRASTKYDLYIGFYHYIDTDEKAVVYNQLASNLNAYLNQSIVFTKNGIKPSKSARHLVADMNEVVNSGLSMYRSRTGFDFGGFSDIVRDKLESLSQKAYSKSLQSTGTGDENSLKLAFQNQLVQELKQLVHSEIKFLLNHDLAILTDNRFIDDYETEQRSTHFALNAGFGGVWLDGKLDNKSSFGSSPYLGLGFPLSTSNIAPKFLRDASLTLGFFTKNFENSDESLISGPIFNRPLYAGLDYKLFSFVRFNAGIALLEEQSTEAGVGDKIFIRPFIGISAKVNISLGLDK